MRDFTFYNPTRIEFGKGKEGNIGQYIKEFGVGSILKVGEISPPCGVPSSVR